MRGPISNGSVAEIRGIGYSKGGNDLRDYVVVSYHPSGSSRTNSDPSPGYLDLLSVCVCVLA